MNSRTVLNSLNWAAIKKDLNLSTRELEVSRCICQGAKITEIAHQLRLAEGTVKTYCRRLYLKLGVDSQCGLALVIASSGRAVSHSQSDPGAATVSR